MLGRAKGLVPLLREASPRMDTEKQLPSDVLDAMHAQGMFRLLIPRSFGGAELDPVDYVQCVEQIASGDASAAWCMNQGSGCSMSAAYLDPAVAREVLGGARDVIAWGQGPGAKAIRAPGGWRVTGSWNFVSGLHNATWFGMHAPCFAADGTPERHADGRPFDRTMLIRADVPKIDVDWNTLGLRGTGSDRFTVVDLFVDDAHTMYRDSDQDRREAGPLYQFSSMQLYAAGFASVGLGIARATLDAFIALARTKTPTLAASTLSESGAVQAILGMNDARWKAARAGLHKSLVDAQADVVATGRLSLAHRIEIRQASTYAIHQAREIVHEIYHEAGATAIFQSHPFEHRLRDMNSVSQQTQGRRSHLETVGTYLMGGTPNLRWV